jgi:hypothetical protein
MSYEGSGGTHQNHSRLVDISQLVHSYLLHQDIPENIKFLRAKLKTPSFEFATVIVYMSL